jgi:hypothetical protein
MSIPQDEIQKYQQLYQQSQATGTTFGQLSGGFLGGYQYSTPIPYSPTPTIQIVPVPIPQHEASDPTKGIEIIYRFGHNRVQAVLIKGTSNPETAKNVFLGQFSDDEPEIVAAVAVWL